MGKNINFDKLKSDTRAVKTEKTTTTTLKKPGRKTLDPGGKKKTEYTKTINIAVELDVLEKIQIAKIKYGDNLTNYINTLIEKDLEANFETYKMIYDMINS